MNRIVVGLSGASGAIYGVRLLETLSSIEGIETHLVLSRAARIIIEHETSVKPEAVEDLADVVHSPENLAACVSSGSFKTQGMIVAPCSMKSLSMIANSINDNLLVRAADVTLKERRRLVSNSERNPSPPWPFETHDSSDGNGRHNIAASPVLLSQTQNYR